MNVSVVKQTKSNKIIAKRITNILQFMLWILTLKKKISSGFVEASKQRIKKMMQLGQMAKPKIQYINLGGPR